MIPLRVSLKGFLCYKDEQDVAFDGRSLWMLAGSNGSGKSAIFDAVTYALFGHHRGGSQHAGELINKDSRSFTIEFDFLLDGQAYRIRRTLQRNPRGTVSGTQLISQRRSGHNGHSAWEPIEGTSRKTEFDAWVREHIGLNYETFTSSVLLLQGKAERLLDATAKGRFEVLAGIVDLDRYERLHRASDDQRKHHEGTVKALRERLAGIPEVTAEAVAEADASIRAAEEARGQARAEVDRWQDLLVKAHQWTELQLRLETARQRLRQAEGLLGDADAIAAAVARLRELRAVLPHVQTILEQRGQIQESERQTAELTRQQEKLRQALEEHQRTLDQAGRKRASLLERITAEEERRRDIAIQFRRAAVLLEKVKEVERQEAALERSRRERAALPADPAGTMQAARAEVEALTGLAQAAPLLTRLATQREQLRAAQAREQAAIQARQMIHGEGARLAADVERLRPQVEEAAQAREQADGAATRARTLLDQARQDLDEIRGLEGARRCRHCGQALTEGHLEVETQRRERELGLAEKQFEQAAAIQREAQAQERRLRDQLAGLEKAVQAKRDEFRDRQNQADQARQDIARLKADCAAAHAELAEPFRARVATTAAPDWPATTYPSAQELADLRQQAGGLAEARRRLREAEELHQQWAVLQSREAVVGATLERLRQELGAEPAVVRQDHARLEAEDQALDRGITALRAEAVEVQKQADGLTRDRAQVQQQLAELLGRLHSEERARQNSQQVLQRSLKELPPAWRTEADRAGLSKMHLWQQELERLVAEKTEERGRELEQARANVDLLRRDLGELEGKQEEFPAEARQEPAQVQAEVQKAREIQAARDDDVSQASHRRRTLGDRQEQREEIQQELLAAEKELAHAKLLAELLGRDRLQLHLLRQAERQVIDYANAVLDRLSGGQLYLRLCGEASGEGNTAKALELEAYNRHTGERPINVAFLSGSQKFRVAVSLALGIGQYASRRHRPIESVIIDEGFGCLDKDGRQVMIQELQNLRSHLQCILLVSHQEEFASAFADGYRFELTSGATRVTRFQP